MVHIQLNLKLMAKLLFINEIGYIFFRLSYCQYYCIGNYNNNYLICYLIPKFFNNKILKYFEFNCKTYSIVTKLGA